MITLFHVTGALIYCDPETKEVTGFDDVFTKLEKAKAHYEACGLGADYVQQFVDEQFDGNPPEFQITPMRISNDCMYCTY